MHPSAGSKGSFLSDYATALAGCAGHDHQDNYDWRRFGPQETSPPTHTWGQRLAARRNKRLHRTGFVSLDEVDRLLTQGLQFIEPHAANFQWLYERLDDHDSRQLLVELVSFRALGHRRVKLPLNRPDHWKQLEAIEKSAEECETIDPNFMGWQLPKLDLRGFGYPIELFGRPDGAMILFLQEQYRCESVDGVIEVEPGDVVVDAGGCWADSALYFAFKAGNGGKVYSFEFLPDNLRIYRSNLESNPTLASQVELLPHPVWSSDDVELFVCQNGPGTTVTPHRRSETDVTVRTMTIDQLMNRSEFSRIDFIKMDIEGAELHALHGAEAAIRRFRPKLAITVYHNLADFWEIPQYIDQLGLGYRFYLRHFTIHDEETVLFAKCDE